MKKETMTRKNVYKAIDSERNFQIDMTERDSRPDMIEDFHVGDAISAIEVNIELAKKAWYKGAVPHQETMEYLRKVAGLCVQAGETYGMPARLEKGPINIPGIGNSETDES